ncbi:uncharacterized protein [Paramisgurnus dabryanus]|uniref:uncharacterized protein n=1 Tax=Paramisgurnus dabryanus TaxID=90735 RepID=UPI0031F3896D
MSPIEDVWDALDQRMLPRVPVSDNIQQLCTAIEEEWINRPQLTTRLTLCKGDVLPYVSAVHPSHSRERDLMKRSYMNNVEGYNETLNSLKMNYNQLTVEKEELKKTLNYMNQKNLELETKVKNLNDALMKKWSYFISSEKKSWSDSRQFCRDRGQDLVIINTEEEQRYVFSIAKEDVWIGLSDIAEEGKMKWVDNTTLDKGFWGQGEPNDQYGNEDCVVIRSSAESSLNNWNDIPCTQTRTWICENL